VGSPVVTRPVRRQNVVVRAVHAVLAVLGGCAVAAAIAVDVTQGRLASAGWVAVGPLPFYAVGLAAYLNQPDSRAVRWLLAVGVGFATEVALCDGLRALAPKAPAAVVVTVAVARQYAEVGSSFAGLGLLGLFPSGRPERPVERRLLWIAAVWGLLLPVVCALCLPTLAPGFFAGGDDPAVASPVHLSVLGPLAGAASLAYRLYGVWTLVGVALLGARFRRSQGRRRRQIGWLHLGAGLSVVLAWMPLFLTAWLVGQPTSDVISALLWPAALLFALGPMVVALRYDGVFGIDRPARRALAISATKVLLTLVQIAIAAAAGLVVARLAAPAVAVLAGVVVGVAFSPVRRQLERLADRWVFGARLDGYSLLSQFGAAVVRVPGPEQLLQELADTLRRALDLTWVQVRLAGPAGAGMATVAASGTAGGEAAALAIPIIHNGETLGLIECGTRADGQLLPEDRRQLEYLAAQVAAAARNVYLSAELAAGVELIRRQAQELTASRERMAASQDAERRRIQRNLHDGVQQEVVALSAKVGLVRQRLRRGEPGGDELLAELQHELGVLLSDIRDVAYAIHPPVLTDRGLLEAIEAQASRLPVPMAVRADPALRGVRFPPQIEATAWYALAEALSNVVKHAGAGEVEVALRHEAGTLALSVRDDGCGFDPARPRGLGLTGLADRLDTVGGTVTIHSGAGAGTAVSLRIPVSQPLLDTTSRSPLDPPSRPLLDPPSRPVEVGGAA
jgi:signal transduction histidine kinase